MHRRARRWSRCSLLFRRLAHIFLDGYLRNQEDGFLISLFWVVLDVFENQIKRSSDCRAIGNTNALTGVGPIERERADHASNIGEANVRRAIVVILAKHQKVVGAD